MKITWESTVCQHDGDPVTVQQLAGDRCRWCVRYRGQGKYFISDLELLAYLKYRFNFHDGIVL